MTLDEKVAWRTACDAVLREAGYRPWFEIPDVYAEYKARRESGRRGKGCKGLFTVTYRLGDCRVQLGIPNSRIPGNDLKGPCRWRFGYRGKWWFSGTGAEDLKQMFWVEMDENGEAREGE